MVLVKGTYDSRRQLVGWRAFCGLAQSVLPFGETPEIPCGVGSPKRQDKRNLMEVAVRISM